MTDNVPVIKSGTNFMNIGLINVYKNCGKHDKF
jgi:hypothetical protein